MARSFDIPNYYKSSLVSVIKQARRVSDSRKKDFSPSVLDLGRLRFKLARHFGFCFGVENAIEIAYRAIAENPGKRVFLLGEMIHNPHVNNDLKSKGVEFLLASDGAELVPFENLSAEDIVIVPAFGTTVELFEKLAGLGVNPYSYNTTCPFVEKVWNRAADLGKRGFTVVVHGKHTHEETRATFSHARLSAPTIVVLNLEEAKVLARYIRREIPPQQFGVDFPGRFSCEFDPQRDLKRIGVVNQTTMLATETREIAEHLRDAMQTTYPNEDLNYHFADTRDTLCYATYENQEAVHGLIQSGADLAVVVGGYNSSNTSHLVELCEKKMPSFHIKDAGEIIDARTIRHLDFRSGKVNISKDWLPLGAQSLDIVLTAGASCPDALVDEVLTRIAELCGLAHCIPQAMIPFRNDEQTING